jgi:predicted kinase
MDLELNLARLERILRDSAPYGCRSTVEEIQTAVQRLAPPYASHLNSPPSPTAIVMCGPAGSGKSTIRGQVMAEFGMTPETTILADQDDLMMMLKDKMACQRTSGEIMRNVLLPAFAKTRHHIVYDSTCRAISLTQDALDIFKQQGYYVVLCEIYTTKETAKARAATRTNRIVPPHVVNDIYDEFAKRASAYMLPEVSRRPIQLDEIRLYNNEREPKLLFKRVGNTSEVIANNNFFFNYRGYGGTRKQQKQQKQRKHRQKMTRMKRRV